MPDDPASPARPDGAVWATTTDGVTTISHPDGTVDVYEPSGRHTRTSVDRVIDESYPDGTQRTIAPDGASWISRPGYGMDHYDSTGRLTAHLAPDGTVVEYGANGEVVTTTRDGPRAAP